MLLLWTLSALAAPPEVTNIGWRFINVWVTHGHADPAGSGKAAHGALREVAETHATLLPGHGGALSSERVQRWLSERAPKHEERIARKRAEKAR